MWTAQSINRIQFCPPSSVNDCGLRMFQTWLSLPVFTFFILGKKSVRDLKPLNASFLASGCKSDLGEELKTFNQRHHLRARLLFCLTTVRVDERGDVSRQRCVMSGWMRTLWNVICPHWLLFYLVFFLKFVCFSEADFFLESVMSSKPSYCLLSTSLGNHSLA